MNWNPLFYLTLTFVRIENKTFRSLKFPPCFSSMMIQKEGNKVCCFYNRI